MAKIQMASPTPDAIFFRVDVARFQKKNSSKMTIEAIQNTWANRRLWQYLSVQKRGSTNERANIRSEAESSWIVRSRFSRQVTAIQQVNRRLRFNLQNNLVNEYYGDFSISAVVDWRRPSHPFAAGERSSAGDGISFGSDFPDFRDLQM
jgi:hypothetical protein